SERRWRRSPFTPPGGTLSLHLLSKAFTPLFKKRSVPSRRASLHVGPVYRAMLRPQTLRFLGGRHPLCGIGVTSEMLVIFRPQLLSARTADSRPGPGPPTRTSTFLTPCSWAATPAFSAATWAAKGVLLREPRKPQPPAVAQESVLPWRSVIVTIVLLKDAWTCAIASSTFLRAFFGFLAPPAAAVPAAACCCF